MGKIEKITADLPDDVYADVEAAVAAGEFESVGDAVVDVMTAWSRDRHAASPEFMAYAKAKIEESRRDTRPGIPAEELFAELRARFADPS